VVWHHRRNSIRAYWKQQYGYGKAEALLERKWPEKYNGVGHLTWAGRVYGSGLPPLVGRAGRIYHGTWGSAPFQSLYQPASNMLRALPLMPEWYLLILALALLSALGALWAPLLLALPLLVLAVGASLVQAGLSTARAFGTNGPRSRVARLKLRSLTAFLHLLQPLARLRGRLHYGLTPWRWRALDLALPWPRTSAIWTEHCWAPEKRLQSIEAALRADGAIVLRGGDFDRWDLEIQSGMLSAVRLLMAVEEHGLGRQLVRFHLWPRCSPAALVLTLLCAALATGATLSQAWAVSAVLGLVTVMLGLRTFQECAAATGAVLCVLQECTDPAVTALQSVEQPGVGGA
jgi:O-antigen biosynthesis protein